LSSSPGPPQLPLGLTIKPSRVDVGDQHDLDGRVESPTRPRCGFTLH
jgi:hypothetical protein